MKTFVGVAVAATLFVLYPKGGFAERPFIATTSAIPIDTNAYRAEAGLQFNKIPLGPRNSVFSVSFLYGLIHNLEIGAEIPYLFVNEDARYRDQLGDMTLRSKVRFLKGRDAAPISLASTILVKIPSAPRNDLANTTGEADVGLSFMASKEISPYKAHLNLSHTFIGNPPKEERPDRRDYALGVEWATPWQNISLTGELFGSNLVSGFANDQWSLASGASYRVRPEMGLDGSLAIGLSKRAPDYIAHLRVSYFYD